MKVDARTKYITNLQELAAEAYGKHELIEAGENSWLIHRPPPHSMCFWTRVVWASPYLICCGDGQSAMFRGHNTDGPVGAVHWVAKSGLSYLAQKCGMGMDQHNIGYTTDVESAREDLIEHQKDFRGNALWPNKRSRDEQGRFTKYKPTEEDEIFTDALNALSDSVETAQQVLYDGFPGSDVWQWAGGVGAVVDPRVVYAQQACKALVRLLNALPNALRDLPPRIGDRLPLKTGAGY
jgi:hypothetical protein